MEFILLASLFVKRDKWVAFIALSLAPLGVIAFASKNTVGSLNFLPIIYIVSLLIYIVWKRNFFTSRHIKKRVLILVFSIIFFFLYRVFNEVSWNQDIHYYAALVRNISNNEFVSAHTGKVFTDNFDPFISHYYDSQYVFSGTSIISKIFNISAYDSFYFLHIVPILYLTFTTAQVLIKRTWSVVLLAVLFLAFDKHYFFYKGYVLIVLMLLFSEERKFLYLFALSSLDMAFVTFVFSILESERTPYRFIPWVYIAVFLLQSGNPIYIPLITIASAGGWVATYWDINSTKVKKFIFYALLLLSSLAGVIIYKGGNTLGWGLLIAVIIMWYYDQDKLYKRSFIIIVMASLAGSLFRDNYIFYRLQLISIVGIQTGAVVMLYLISQNKKIAYAALSALLFIDYGRMTDNAGRSPTSVFNNELQTALEMGANIDTGEILTQFPLHVRGGVKLSVARVQWDGACKYSSIEHDFICGYNKGVISDESISVLKVENILIRYKYVLNISNILEFYDLVEEKNNVRLYKKK